MWPSTVFFVLMVIFLVMVAPLWIIFHYITKWKRMKAATPADGQILVDKGALDSLRHSAESLDGRLRNLEKLLDADTPGWRKK